MISGNYQISSNSQGHPILLIGSSGWFKKNVLFWTSTVRLAVFISFSNNIGPTPNVTKFVTWGLFELPALLQTWPKAYVDYQCYNLTEAEVSSTYVDHMHEIDKLNLSNYRMPAIVIEPKRQNYHLTAMEKFPSSRPWKFLSTTQWVGVENFTETFEFYEIHYGVLTM